MERRINRMKDEQTNLWFKKHMELKLASSIGPLCQSVSCCEKQKSRDNDNTFNMIELSVEEVNEQNHY